MYCRFCGKQIADSAAFCQYCGKAAAQEDGLAKLVAAARTGSQDALSSLYEKTYSQVYYTVKSMIKDEDAVFDVVQDTYIKAFEHLDSFRGDTKFLPWVRQIAANTARDWLKKKRPLLFTELGSGDEQEVPVEEMFRDERMENIPEEVIEQEETKRLLREILEELPEDQRAAIGMYYYEELSVKEIADAMSVSESAVKSRLMYGRNKIEKKVRELEKKGTKLYGLAPIPFLLWLFRSQEAHAAGAPDGQMLQNILASHSAGRGAAKAPQEAITGETARAAGTAGAAQGIGTAGAAAAGGTAAAGGLSALKLGLIILAATAVVGVGGYGAARIFSHADESEKRPAMEDAAGRGEEDGEEDDVTEALEEPSPVHEALEQYRVIVSQADSYGYEQPKNEAWEFVGYCYALVRMDSEDTVPTLLLGTEHMFDTMGFFQFRIFQYDPDTKTIRQPAEVLSLDRSKGSFGMAGDGHGILEENLDGVNDYWENDYHKSITRYTLEGDAIRSEVCWSGDGNEFDDSDEALAIIEIDWNGIEDLTALEHWAEPVVFIGPEDRNCTSYVIPEGVTKIGSKAFYGCRALTSVEIPASVTKIGSDAFAGCDSLASISLPQGLDITKAGIPDGTEIIWTTPGSA